MHCWQAFVKSECISVLGNKEVQSTQIKFHQHKRSVQARELWMVGRSAVFELLYRWWHTLVFE